MTTTATPTTTAADIPVPPGHVLNDEPPASAAPIWKDAPTITGSTVVGQTLTCTMGNWDNEPTAYAYYWARSGVGPTVPTGPDYPLTDEDNGKHISCFVVASNAFGQAGVKSNDVGPITAPAKGESTT